MTSGVQRYKRTKMVLPLRVWPGDENGPNSEPQLAHTVDITPIGGRLGGLRHPLENGQTIWLQRGKNRSQFRVVWTKQVGPGAIQAGIESVALEEKLWGIELPDEPGSRASSADNSLGQRNFAIPTPLSFADAYQLPIQPPLLPPHGTQPANLPRQWMAIAAGLLLAVSLLGFVGYRILKNSEQAATMPLPTMVPGAVTPLVASSPRPYGNVKVVFSREESGTGSNRLQVPEPPHGHLITPQAHTPDLQPLR